MDARAPNPWKERLDVFLETAASRDPSHLIEALCELAEIIGDDAAEALLSMHPELFDYAPVLGEAHRQKVERKDIAETRRLLREEQTGRNVTFRDVASPAAIGAYERVSTMFDRLDFRRVSRIVMVGCGMLPVTLLHIHDRTDVREIVGLDIVPDSVETARELADRLGYSRVKIELCDGRAYDFSRAQVIFVANMVSPKAAVLSRIADAAAEGVQVVVREPYSLGRLLTESVEDSLDSRLEITGKGHGWRGNLSLDLYLRRRVG
jgi:SAM-dependent methyltransferase